MTMLITWLATSRPHFVTQETEMAYISDIGADYLKPLFVTGCTITAICFFLSLVIERWLRHSGRLVPAMRTRERVFGILAIIGSIMSGVSQILLSILDTKRHPTTHRICLLLFIVGLILTAVFTVAEYRWISKDFLGYRQLRVAYLAKAIIVGILVILAFAFGACLVKKLQAGAILEWVIAFGITLYLLTFVYDLRMSKGVHKHELSRENLTGNQMREVESHFENNI